MKKRCSLLLAGIIACITSYAQQLYFPRLAAVDSSQLAEVMPLLSQKVMAVYHEANEENYLANLFKLQIVAEDYKAANATIKAYRKAIKTGNMVLPGLAGIQYELYDSAKQATKGGFDSLFISLLQTLYSNWDDKTAFLISTAFISRYGVGALLIELNQSLANQKGKDSISINDALTICKNYCLYRVFKNIEPLAAPFFEQQDAKRYITDSVLIKTKQGITLSAIVVRKRSITAPQPTALLFTIYAGPFNLYQAKEAAVYGYVGVVGLTRGKGQSPDEVVPYEHEVDDVNAVIDWITHQPWSNGKVGMYSGSYNGFSQWAATKHLHPALKTIVPYVAAIPGQGLPMENNVFLNGNYGWAFYVTDNKYLDDKVYNDPQRWDNLQNKWYASGVAYRKIDSIDGTPNKWLQRWLKHPAYDEYWQHMVPYKQDYAHINIPVLTITGYYDDGQISALHYLKEHYKYNKNANHYLIIGPYDHFGAQRGGTPELRGYTVDPIALISTRDITFQWLDYILKNGPKPAIVQDKINFEIMGANTWKHVASLDKMHNAVLTLYLSDTKSGDRYQLSETKPDRTGFLPQEVDFADRTSSNNNYYPDPIVSDSLDAAHGLVFITEPFTEPISVNGTFEGELKARINKKDIDIGITLYELMPDGKYFHLSYFLGRASYAKDMAHRELLTPGVIETIPFERSRMVSRQLSKGSRLVVVLNIDKNPFAQINYGTGKDVSDETIQDAKEPLRIEWYNDSFIKIPVLK
jgi:putative CocE/NonD family hydrolase